MHSIKHSIITALIVSLSSLPQVFAAQAIEKKAEATMVSTQDWVNDQTKEELAANILQVLDRDYVRKKLVASGISPDEAKTRVASLNYQDLQNMNAQIEQARYGGDILIAILVIVLIIYLVKRI